jgi:hypothetical protein
MPTDGARTRRLNATWTSVAFGLSLLWSLPCHAEDAHPPLSPMRAEVIAGFRYDSKPVSNPDRGAGIRAPRNGAEPVDPNVVAMDPFVVRADRGLSPQEFRSLGQSFQEQHRLASEPKIPFVKMHDIKINRTFHFGYVTILGVPVVAGFSW